MWHCAIISSFATLCWNAALPCADFMYTFPCGVHHAYLAPSCYILGGVTGGGGGGGKQPE